MIKVTVNGKERELVSETLLPDYLSTLGVNLKLVAVALNGAVLRKDELWGVTVRNGDSVEIVQAVGGG